MNSSTKEEGVAAKKTVIDITSDSLRNKGITLKKEAFSMALYFNGSCARTTFFPSDPEKSSKRLLKKMDEETTLDGITKQEVLSCMATNYPLLVDGFGSSTSEKSSETTTPKIPLRGLD